MGIYLLYIAISPCPGNQEEQILLGIKVKETMYGSSKLKASNYTTQSEKTNRREFL